MKKLISILLVIVMMASLAACGNKENTENTENPSISVDAQNNTEDKTQDNAEDKAETDNKEETSKDNEPENTQKPAESKPSQKPEASKEPQKPAESKPAENKPTQKPAESTPTPTPTPTTVGTKLLAEFKAIASGKSAEEIANKLVESSVIQFPPVVMEVEEGFLTGFGNNEIKGFKSGAIFSPMMGSIPFVGYIFELENASDTSSFISDLRAKANLRWNVCTEADEMVTGSVGNKVFFVMCLKEFEE